MPTPRERLKQRKLDQVRQEIINVAARLIAERGYRGVKINDIATELGYTKSAVYYYFKNKADLLWSIFEEIYDSYIKAAVDIRDSSLSPRDAMAKAIRQHVEWVATRTHWTAIYFREEGELSGEQQRIIRSRKREYDRVLENIYAEGVRSGVFRDMPPALAINGILGACNWVQMWYHPSGRISVDDIVRHYSDLLAGGYEIGA